MKSLALRAASSGRKVTFLTTCARDHFTWSNEIEPGCRTLDGIQVHFFPVDEDRDLGRFLKVQNAISNGSPCTEEDERAWMDNNVNSSALYRHLKEEGDSYDRIVAGPYLFGLVFYACLIRPEKTLLVPCLHDEAFAYLSIMRELFDGVSGLLFNTRPEQDLAGKIFGNVETRGTVVGMGLEPFEADPALFLERHGLEETPYVLYSGRREPLKGTPLMMDYLEAFAARTGRKFRVVLTGSGPFDIPSGLAGRVTDLGFVSEADKHAAMAGALAFIHPSINESLGIVLLEAWMAGTPALVHAKSAVLAWQCRSSGAGLWFRHYPDFEEELGLLMDRADLRKAMGQSGRQYVLKEYAWPAVEQRLFGALDA